MGGVGDAESVIVDYISSDFLFSVADSSCIVCTYVRAVLAGAECSFDKCTNVCGGTAVSLCKLSLQVTSKKTIQTHC